MNFAALALPNKKPHIYAVFYIPTLPLDFLNTHSRLTACLYQQLHGQPSSARIPYHLVGRAAPSPPLICLATPLCRGSHWPPARVALLIIN